MSVKLMEGEKEQTLTEAVAEARKEAEEAHPYDDVIEAEAEEKSAEPVVEEEAPKKPFYKGLSKEVQTPEELAQYALELEKKAIMSDAQLMSLGKVVPGQEQGPTLGQAESPEQAEADKTFYSQVAEEFILNPQQAVKMLEERISRSVRGEAAKEAGKSAFFKSFYEKNEDLAGCEDIVDMILARKMGEWANVPVGKASELLAAETRSRLASLRGSANTGGQTQVLGSRPAHALGSSGPTPPKAPAKTETDESFVSSLKGFQAKKRKRA